MKEATMKLEIKETVIPGCRELFPFIFKDKRGTFVKTFSAEAFAGQGLENRFVEEFYSSSVKGVLRGLHFQTPPLDLAKLVYCLYGSVYDVVVDLRVGSPAYGKYDVFDLEADRGNMLYLPPGLAHGFYVKSERAILVYQTTSAYSPQHDSGIRWDSLDIPWPDREPLVSERDAGLVALADFKSPFIYK
jgi:dTDP-4-dehydrorhamnose 3,5-epimerase